MDDKQKVFESEQEVYDLYKIHQQKVIIFQGIVYNIDGYISEHPGGADLLEDELGKNIDQAFEDAEHTQSARNIFKDLTIVGRMKEGDSSSTNSSAQDAK